MKEMIAVLISALILLTGCGATKKPDPVPPSSSGEYLVYKPAHFAEMSVKLPEGQMIEMHGFRLGPGPLIDPEGEISPVSEEEKKRASLLETLGEIFAK